VEIVVNEDDSLTSVLDRINASGAGVIASFDAATEMVSLRASMTGASAIDLGLDTSGFLAAMKLNASANFSSGVAARDMFLRDSVPGASNGVLEVNGQLISIDPGVDTLASLAQKLDDLEGVEAFLDGGAGALTVRSEIEGGSLSIVDYSGTLAALGINDGTYNGTASTLRTVQARNGRFQLNNRDKVVDRLLETFGSLNQALETTRKPRRSPFPSAIRSRTHSATPSLQSPMRAKRACPS
jgi:hypothetical protein